MHTADKPLCPSCLKGDCYRHVYDFLLQGRVTLCRYTDPNKQHGKLPLKKGGKTTGA